MAAETDDNTIRDRTVQACVELLERADRGEADVDIGFEAAHTLGLLGQTEYVAVIYNGWLRNAILSWARRITRRLRTC